MSGLEANPSINSAAIIENAVKIDRFLLVGDIYNSPVMDVRTIYRFIILLLIRGNGIEENWHTMLSHAEWVQVNYYLMS